MRLEKGGLPVIFHAHDELILLSNSDGSKEDAKATAFRLMTPLAVEGDFC